MRVGDRCLPVSFRWTEPFMYCTNWIACPSGSVTTKLRLPLRVGLDLGRHRDALAGEVIAQAAGVRRLEADANQAILVALQGRRDLDELPVVDLEGVPARRRQ